MKKSTLLILVLICTQTFSQITFQKYYDPGDSRGYGIQQTPEGGYISVISLECSPSVLMRLDSIGNFVWGKEFDPEYGFHDVLRTSDGGYLVTGDMCLTQPFVIKTDSLGDTLWCRKFDPVWWTSGKAIEVNGGYVLFSGNKIYKIDLSGNLAWYKSYSCILHDINLTPDSGFILSGRDNYDLVIIRTDSLGDSLWTKKFSNGQYFSASVIAGNNNSFIIGGTIGGVPFLIRTDSSGDTIWTKQYSGNTSSGRISLLTNSNEDIIMFEGDWPYKLYVLKTDGFGNPIWAKEMGNDGVEFGNAQITTDHGFILTCAWYTGGANDAAIIKLDSLGNGSCKDTVWYPTVSNMTVNVSNPGLIVTSIPINEFYMQPNIVNSVNALVVCSQVNVDDRLQTLINPLSVFLEEDKIVIQFNSSKKVTANLRLIDITGKIMIQKDFNLKQGFNSTQFLAGELSSGIYFLNMYAESKAFNTKFIVK